MKRTPRSIRALLLAVILLVALPAACGPAPTALPTRGSPLATPAHTPAATATPSAPSDATAETPAAAATPEGTPDPPSLTLTLENQGQTITLRPGDRFLLKLGEEYDWNVTVDNTSVVDRVVGIAVVRGAQGVYEARQAGTATLSANGDPPCRKLSPPCAAPSRYFEMTIIVE